MAHTAHAGKWLWIVVAGAVVAMAAGSLVAGATEFEIALERLGSQDATVRAAAVDELARGGDRALGKLLEALDGEHSPLVKAGLAAAVQKIGVSPDEEEALASLLASRSPSTRQAAIAILANAPALVTKELLTVARNDRELPAIRAGAAVALSRSPDLRDALKAIANDLGVPESVRGGAIRALATTGTEGAGDVRSIATDSKRSHAERRVAIWALAQPASPGRDALGGLAGAITPWVRAEATAAVTARGDANDAATLASWTVDLDGTVRYLALEGLLQLGGGATYRETVIGLLTDGDPRVQALAARFLGPNGTDVATRLKNPLVGLLGSPNFQVRYEAALALLAHGDKAGLATMNADRASLNLSQAAQANAAYNRINAAGK